MVRYLLVEDSEGRVLTELASAEEAVRLLGRFACNPYGGLKVSVVRLDHQQSELTDITSTVSVRPLPPLTVSRPRVKTPPPRA